MAINVFYNLFIPHDVVRSAELLSCFSVMYTDPDVDRIVVLTALQDLQSVHPDNRIHFWQVPHRPTFQDYFNAVAEETGDDDVNVILNSDCFIDPRTTRRLKWIRKDEAYCITRHELASLVPLQIDTAKTRSYARQYRNDMQDCWVIRGQPRPGMWLEFCPGQLGCDNRLAYELQSAGYSIVDPHLTVRVLHHHGSAYGTVNRSGDVVPAPYAYPAKHGFWERTNAFILDAGLSLLRLWHATKGVLRRAIVRSKP